MTYHYKNIKVLLCKKINLRNTNKILLIRFSSIGDIVLTSPIIRCLKMQLPNAEIHFLTKHAYNNILVDNPYITKLHYLEKPLIRTLQKIKAERFDLIIDLHKNLRTYLLTALISAKTIRFNKLNMAKWLMVNLKINRLPHKHLVDRYFDRLKLLNVQNDGQGLDFFIHPQNELNLPFNKKPYVAIAVGAKHYTKTIPIQHLFSIISKINFPVVLLGDAKDDITASILKNYFKDKVENYCNKLNLQQSAFLIKQAKIVLTGDTALMHIATAFNKTLFTIWGNTVPQFGMFPYVFQSGKQKNINELNIYEDANLSCRPCSKIGYPACPKDHFKCMTNIDIDKIVYDIGIKFG